MHPTGHSPVPGQMMQRPLQISALLRHADRYFGQRDIVSFGDDRQWHRYTYRDCHRRSRQLANALGALGVHMGDRVGTLAWNGYRHLELYYGVAGSGAVCHTMNPRLHVEQLAFMVNDAGDKVVFFERSMAPLVRAIAPHCPHVEAYIVLDHDCTGSGLGGIPRLASYEELIAAHGDDYLWPVFDEDAAAGLCYTSGTTGNPKGVLYSHRSTMLHAWASIAPDAFNLSARDCILAVVPMFHVNAWGLPYAAPMVGAKLVLPGPALDGQALFNACELEGVTFAAGVPTIWLGLLNHVRERQLAFSTFARVVIGGSACPPHLMDGLSQLGLQVIHAFGMTELSPVATVCTLQAQHLAWPQEQRTALLRTQGRPLFGVDLKVVDDDGVEQPWDGKAQGHLMVRGQWVVDAYFGQPPGSAAADGWFATGDMARVTAEGYLTITDRSKDVIKSGGEWIGSIDLENIAMTCPAVALAACVGVPHPKWDERPLLVVVAKPGLDIDKATLLALYEHKVPRWWVPDDVLVVPQLPLGPTGKVLKQQLRHQYRDQLLGSMPVRN